MNKEISWPEYRTPKDYTQPLKPHIYFSDGWNAAIDACKEAVINAQPKEFSGYSTETPNNSECAHEFNELVVRSGYCKKCKCQSANYCLKCNASLPDCLCKPNSEAQVDDLAKLFGTECCINEDKPYPCINCRYKAAQVIRFGYRKESNG